MESIPAPAWVKEESTKWEMNATQRAKDEKKEEKKQISAKINNFFEQCKFNKKEMRCEEEEQHVKT
jgi:hypothetical protein